MFSSHIQLRSVMDMSDTHCIRAQPAQCSRAGENLNQTVSASQLVWKTLCRGVIVTLTKHGVQELGEDPSLTVRSTIFVTFSFLYLFVASGLLGAAFGLTAALLLKASPSIQVHQVSFFISGHAQSW